MKKLHLFAALTGISCSIQLFAQPEIKTFTPQLGPIGTKVTIKGSNFNTSAANNVVYFGTVKAKIDAATDSSLAVSVPRGANSQAISVTDISKGFTAYSAKPFMVTFPGGDNVLTETSFSYIRLPHTAISPQQVTAGDIDGDGKPDLATICDPGGTLATVSVFQNTTERGKISFATKMDLRVDGSGGSSVKLADLDSDGLLDLIASSDGHIYTFRNESTIGKIAFSRPFILTEGLSATYSVEINDMDGDGKPDLVFTNFGRLSVFRNLSRKGSFAFSSIIAILPATAITVGDESLKIADMDGDLRPDIVILFPRIGSLSVLRNISQVGAVAFETPKQYPIGEDSYPNSLSLGDIDGDGLIDIAVANPADDRIIVYKNISQLNTLSFSGFDGIAAVYQTQNVTLGDVNGDGRLDFAMDRPAEQEVSILLNKSRPCIPAYGQQIRFVGYYNYNILIVDLNGDSKPEIVYSKPSGDALEIHQNNIGQTLRACVGGQISFPSSILGISYQWQKNIGSGFESIADDTMFVGTKTFELQLRNAHPSLHNNKFRCIVDGDTSNILTLSLDTIFVPEVAITFCPFQVCSAQPVLFTASTKNVGMNPQFQWEDSTDTHGWKQIVGATESLLYYTPLPSAFKIRCRLKANYECANPESVFSNVLAIQPTASVVPAVAVTYSGCETGSLKFFAQTTNGGLNSTVEWFVNDVRSGVGATFILNNAITRTKVFARLFSNAACANPQLTLSPVTTVNCTTTAVPNVGGVEEFKISPNPGNGLVTVRLDVQQRKNVWFEVFDAQGQIAFKSVPISVVGKVARQIDLRGKPAGYYFLLAHFGGEHIMKKLVIIH